MGDGGGLGEDTCHLEDGGRNPTSPQIEGGQLQLKQNLVKFNNFVREKQDKVSEGRVSSKRWNPVQRIQFIFLIIRFVDANRKRGNKISLLDTEKVTKPY